MDNLAIAGVTPETIKYLKDIVHFEYRLRGSKFRNLSIAETKKDSDESLSDHFFKSPSFRKKKNSGRVSLKARKTPMTYYSWQTVINALRDRFSEEFEMIVLGLCFRLSEESDRLILGALGKVPNIVGGRGLTVEKIEHGFEMLDRSGVPDDGDRVALVGWMQWRQMLEIESFAKEKFVAEKDLPWPGVQAKKWRKTLWLPQSNLECRGLSRVCHWFHREAIGHIAGENVEISIKKIEDRNEFEISAKMKQAAKLIDRSGAIQLHCVE